MNTTAAPKVTLSQVAPWNARLGNPYRTRWAMVAGRRFKVSADHLNDMWTVEEVDENGEGLVLRRPAKGEDITDPANYDFGFTALVFTLAEARAAIAAEATR